MKAASLQIIKKELKHRSPDELLIICLRLARHKKENKELLDYLLFDQENEAGFIDNIKEHMDELFEEINQESVYYAKKSIQKVLRTVNKFLRYSGKKETAIEVLIYFCYKMQNMEVNFRRSSVLKNLYERQLLKIEKHMATIHEDLRMDYQNDFEELLSN